MWHFLFPTGSTRNAPDEMFTQQHAALTAAGFTASILPDDARLLPGIPPGSIVVYRGWMMTSEEYAHLITRIDEAQAIPLTSHSEYLTAHHLPNWYPVLAEFTPETHIFPVNADLVAELKTLNWGSYFIKDYVKSLKTGRGSILHDPAEAPKLVSEMLEYRGQIEGGICVRRVEKFLPESEQRYFVLHGVSHSSNGEPIPAIVQSCAERIASPFFSVDVVRRSDGMLRIVEIGDGQVSGLVGWSPDTFAAMWK
jgi:hypothetical protein